MYEYQRSLNNKTKYNIDEYSYDLNGNMTQDHNKGITIEYNYLNLPSKITKDDGTIIHYLYTATGQKYGEYSYIPGLEDLSSRLYLGRYIKSAKSSGTEVLDRIFFDEGMIACTQVNGQNEYTYQTYIKDHLGNTRAIFQLIPQGQYPSATPQLLEEDDYYPFGLRQNNTTQIQLPGQRYLYNGKELDEDIGLYDFGARFYDPARAQWTTVDPLAEKARRWSLYTFCFNNPLRFIDPDGMFSTGIMFSDPPMGEAFEEMKENFKTETRTHEENTHATADGNAATKALINGTDFQASSQYTNGDFNIAGGGDGKKYDGSYLKSKNDYDYSQDEIPGKLSDDLMYIINGGPWYLSGARASQLFWRDATAKENRSTVTEAAAYVFVGEYRVASNVFHRIIKPLILKDVGMSNYARYVGRNPNISIKRGEIILKGTGQGFKGKEFPTGLKGENFFHK